jgi:hypothetical protein
MTRKFFDKYQDRILFATDATPHGDETPQQIFGNELYEIYYRFLETEMSISTTLQRRFRRRGAGVFTESACRRKS